MRHRSTGLHSRQAARSKPGACLCACLPDDAIDAFVQARNGQVAPFEWIRTTVHHQPFRTSVRNSRNPLPGALGDRPDDARPKVVVGTTRIAQADQGALDRCSLCFIP